MKRLYGVIAGLTLAASAVATQADAQELGSARAVNFGIAGGVAMPMGDQFDALNTGYNITGSLGFQPMAMPVGVRFDAMYNSFGTDADPDLNILAGSANAILTIANNVGVKPYAIGGVGAYRTSLSDVDGSDDTNFGLNGGAGLQFPLAGFSTYVEARYHSIFAEGGNSNFIPLVFGITF